MASAEHVSRQVQPYLPGMEPHPSEVKQPHQMSPEEFANHPLALFHSTTGRSNLHERRLPTQPMHLGTRQAALHRRAIGGSAGELYTFHDEPVIEGPESVSPKVTLQDATTNHLYGRARRLLGPSQVEESRKLPSADRAPVSGYYTNLVEHPGSISVVRTHPTSELVSHHEAVRRAISDGKESEVHPVTLRLYHEGALKQPEDITEEDNAAMRKAANRELRLTEPESMSMVELHTQVKPVPGSQQAWALGGHLNVGLTRTERGWDDSSPEARSYVSLNERDRDPRLFPGRSRKEKEMLAELGGYNNVVEDRNYTRAQQINAQPDTRGPDLDRIRHYYRAAGYAD